MGGLCSNDSKQAAPDLTKSAPLHTFKQEHMKTNANSSKASMSPSFLFTEETEEYFQRNTQYMKMKILGIQ